MVDERASQQKNKTFYCSFSKSGKHSRLMYVSYIVDENEPPFKLWWICSWNLLFIFNVLRFNSPVVERRLRGHRGQDQGVRRIFQHQDGAEGRYRHRRGRPRQADGASRDGERRGQSPPLLQGDQIGQFLPVRLILEAHCDFLKGWSSPK